jgi:spermidine/putrescine-binding protein
MMRKVISLVFLMTVFCGMVFSQASSGSSADAYNIDRYIKVGEDITEQLAFCLVVKNPNNNNMLLMVMKEGGHDLESGLYDWIELSEYNTSTRQFGKVMFNSNDLGGVTATATINNGKLSMKIMMTEMPDMVFIELEGTFFTSRQL